jgi:hypothetical protein
MGWDFLLLVIASRPVLGPTEAPVHWVPGILWQGVKRLERISIKFGSNLLGKFNFGCYLSYATSILRETQIEIYRLFL